MPPDPLGADFLGHLQKIAVKVQLSMAYLRPIYG
jgi:hypothetical protein